MTDGDATRVAVIVTGFGAFGPVRVNPSATIAQRVAQYTQEHPLARHGAVRVVHVDYVELETSIAAVTAYFATLAEKLRGLLDEDAELKVLLFHVGVHSKEKEGVLRVEVRGYNELFASIPDVRGVTFDHDPIDRDVVDGTAHFLESRLARPDTPQLAALEAVVAELNASPDQPFASAQAEQERAHGGHRVDVPPPLLASVDTNDRALQMPRFQPVRWQISRDAGRYLCNCALYNALKLQEAFGERVTAIFVHVVDPTQGTERVAVAEGAQDVVAGAIDRYNPTLMTQTEQVTRLAHALLAML